MPTLNELVTLFEHLNEAAYIVDQNRKILYFNPVAESITGYDSKDLIGRHCYDNILNHIDEEGNHLCLFGCPLQTTIEAKEILKNTLYLHHKYGHRVKVDVVTIPYVFTGSDEVFGVELFNEVGDSEDIAETLKSLKALNQTDDLTKLLNRRHLSQILTGKLNPFTFKVNGCLFLDVDDFRAFNNTYGHELGDKVLSVLSETIRKNIGVKDLAIRYGGEEFLIILNNIKPSNIKRIAEKIRMLIKASKLTYEGLEHTITVSIGASTFGEVEALEEAIKEADLAMLEAKKTGKDKVVLGPSISNH